MANKTIILPLCLAEEVVAANNAYQSALAKAEMTMNANSTLPKEKIPALEGEVNVNYLEEKLSYANFIGSLEELVRWIDRHGSSDLIRETHHGLRINYDQTVGLVSLYKKYVDSENDAQAAIDLALKDVPDDGPDKIHFHLHERTRLMKSVSTVHKAYMDAGVAFADMISDMICRKGGKSG